MSASEENSASKPRGADPDAAFDPEPRCPECNGEMQDADHDGATIKVCEDCGYNV